MGVLAFILEGLAFASLDLGIDAIKNLDKGQGDKTKVELVIGSGSADARIVSPWLVHNARVTNINSQFPQTRAARLPQSPSGTSAASA